MKNLNLTLNLKGGGRATFYTIDAIIERDARVKGCKILSAGVEYDVELSFEELWQKLKNIQNESNK